MSVSGTAIDDMVAVGGEAPKDVEDEVKATGCGFEDRPGWDGPAVTNSIYKSLFFP